MIDSPVGFDFETHKIAAMQLAPRAVCCSLAYDEDGQEKADLAGTYERQKLDAVVESILDLETRVVGQSVAYDLAVAVANWPHLIPLVWEKLELGLVHCTKIREKMLNLASTGNMEYAVLPDGTNKKLEYNLAEMVNHHFGVDLSDQKKGSDAWRTNYAVLDGVPLEQWPAEARDYAIMDSVWAKRLFAVQEARRRDLQAKIGIDPLATEAMRVALDFGLYLVSAWGIATDPIAVLKMEADVMAELTPEKLNLLIQYGILRPGQPPRQNAKGHKDHIEGCLKRWKERDAQGREVTVDCKCPIKMTAGVDESINTEKLKGYVQALADRNQGISIKMTPPSEKFPKGQISVDDDWLTEHAALDPVLTQYQHRAKLQKMATTEIPRLKDEHGNPARRIHPRFDCLKETGRTSSYADKIYPSANVQNVDPRARYAYVPDVGWVMFSVDFSQMELGTLAQKCINLFGESKLADIINAGTDVHGWLGAQIACETDPNFRSYVGSTNATTRDDVYSLFSMLKEGPPEQQKFYAHFRKLAKPTGLGYPGGLGPETFIAFAKGAPYEVDIDLETAERLRQIWMESLPEMELYFKWINEQCEDPHNQQIRIKNKKTGEWKYVKGYAYTSPFGLYRAGALYCAAANGAGLQTFAADGFNLACINVIRGCYDPAIRSILSDDQQGPTTRPLGVIHDEILGQTRDDQYAADRVTGVAKIMEDAMRLVTPDVKVRAQPCMMRRWNKDAKPVYDAGGRLTVWEPDKSKAA
jgi:hypothetical protein